MQAGAPDKSDQSRALWLSTIAFTVCFAVWTIFAIIGLQIKADIGLSDTQFGLLAGTPILAGSLIRPILGIWADQYGGRVIYTLTMLSAAMMTALLTFADSYPTFLLAALGVGIAGGSFSVGVAYVAKWFPKERQGMALGIFGAGNVGAAVTKFAAPVIMIAYGWHAVALVWAAVLAVTAVIFFLFTKDDPDLARHRASGQKPEPLSAMLAPLKSVQVWRFSLYYFFVFGAFVALALWLPRYLIGVYGLDIATAGAIAALYSIPASIFRAYGGHLADKYGARRIMYWTFMVSVACTFVLSYPPTQYVIEGIHGPMAFSIRMSLVGFIVVTFVLGFFMSLGKAAVYKHIPIYYPDRVGAVGGTVGLVGGLGGFVLPIAFGALNDLTGVWQSCFWLLFLIVTVSLVWMHFAIREMEKSAAAAASRSRHCPSCRKCSRSMARRRRVRWRRTVRSRTGDRRTRTSGRVAAGRLRAVICGSRLPVCCCRSRSGWYGLSWWRSCRRSGLPSTTSNCSGSPLCRVFPGQRSGSSTDSCLQSSAVGCGRRSRPGHC